MHQTVSVAPPNSLILILDRTIGIIPESLKRGLIAATPSCIAVGTLSEYDGETSLLLSDDETFYQPDTSIVFDSMIETPSKMLTICSVLGETFLETKVPSPKTRVRIWANDLLEPSFIVVIAV